MIPIRFRAWDIENREMIRVDEINFGMEVVGTYIGTDERGDPVFRYLNFKQVILMQYTGLKDKNGVEIYEGDIVKHTDNFSNITTINKVYWKGGSLVFDVVVDEGLVYDVPLYKITEDNAEGYDDELEVLGNIYENPELLKEQNK